jgi:membrane associated rhomboid family serine protease
MARSDSTTLTLPPFSGVPRLIMLAYIAVFLTLAILPHVAPVAFVEGIYDHLALWPFRVAMGQIWQLVTYAFMPVGILASVFAMLTVWTCGFILEGAFGARWLAELYFFSAAGGALLGGLISFTGVLGISPDLMALGPFAPIYGLLIVIAVRFGDLEFFLLPTVRVKAKYMVAIFLLVDIASLLTSSARLDLVVDLSGAVCGYLFLRFAPRRGLAYGVTERWFALRNQYYKNKRRRAAKKFEVYMRKQNRDVRFDSNGRYIEPDDRDPNDKRWMN